MTSELFRLVDEFEFILEALLISKVNPEEIDCFSSSFWLSFGVLSSYIVFVLYFGSVESCLIFESIFFEVIVSLSLFSPVFALLEPCPIRLDQSDTLK